MSANENDPALPPRNQRRRSSFVDIFSNRPSNDVPNANSVNVKPTGSAMASAMAQQAQQSRTRRLSITSLGLSGSPTHGQQTSPFSTVRDRGQSLADSGKRPQELEESAVDEDVDAVGPMDGSRPNSPTVTRRVSFGAKAYRDNRSSSGASSNTPNSTENTTSNSSKVTARKGPPSPTARKDGFNWSDNLRNRAERTSISTAAGSSGNGAPPLASTHNRSRSLATSDNVSTITGQSTPAVKQPAKPMPDHFQERILKGDFYMD